MHSLNSENWQVRMNSDASHFAFGWRWGTGSNRSWNSLHLLVAPMAGIAKGWAGIGLSSGTFST